MFYKLFDLCIVKNGTYRSIIHDFQRQKIYTIPLIVGKFLIANHFFSKSKIVKSFENGIELLNWLLQKDLLFTIESQERIFFQQTPQIKFDIPEFISSISWEFNYNDLNRIIPFIDEANTKHLKIFFDENDKINEILKSIELLKESTLFFLDLYFDNINSKFIISNYSKLITNNFVRRFVLYNNISNIVTKNKKVLYSNENKYLYPYQINSFDDLILDITLFIESQNYNPYYNKKLYIDKKGFIKSSFLDNNIGLSLYEIDIKSYLRQIKFKIWSITKGVIKDCKDCELQYMCIDSRIPSMVNDYLYIHEDKCKYDPIEGVWM